MHPYPPRAEPLVLSVGNGQNIYDGFILSKLHRELWKASQRCIHCIPSQTQCSLFIQPYLWAYCPTMGELEPGSKVLKHVIQSAVNNLQGARLGESLLLEKDKDNGES